MSDRPFDIIDVRVGLEEENDRYAAQVRAWCREHGIFLINLMGSPGAGKTTLLCRILDELTADYTVGVIEADVDADVDAQTVAAHGYDPACVGTIERTKFYEKAGRAYITICTSERQPYGCIILQKGVM